MAGLELVALAGLAGFSLGYAAGRSERLRPAQPARLVPLAFKAPGPGLAADPTAAEREAWDLHLVSFALAGDLVSPKFSLRQLRGVFCSEQTWEIYTGLLADLGAIEKRPRSATRWAQGWGVRHLRLCLKHGAIRPPYPAGKPPACGWSG